MTNQFPSTKELRKTIGNYSKVLPPTSQTSREVAHLRAGKNPLTYDLSPVVSSISITVQAGVKDLYVTCLFC